MLNILIPTMPDDTHAIYVHLAMQEKGYNSLLWYTADFPTLQTHSFELNNNGIEWTSQGYDFEIKKHPFDLVWYRRPRAPILSTHLHKEDRLNSKKENRSFFQNFWQIIAPDALWINPSDNARRANCKMLQLKIAMQLGLIIPETLMSNDPVKIKSFIAKNGVDNTLYKTFTPLVWKPNTSLHLTYATTITQHSLPSDAVLQSTAGIFQKKIDKAFELRVTYFGHYPVAVKLHSQEHPNGKLDWRAIPTHELVIEPYQLPEVIHEKCKAFMDAFGLLFGCFDFIVTPKNEYCFLEINEQGQFLWVEELNADIKMLDIFTQFLTHKSKSFHYTNHVNAISISDFNQAIIKTRDHAIQHHLNPDLC